MLSQVALSLVRPMTSYRLLELGQPDVLIGWVAAVYALAPVLLALPLGRFGGSRATVLGIMGCGLLTLGSVVLGFGVEVWHLVTGSIILGAGNLGQMIAYQSLIARESAANDYDKNYGWFGAGASLGQLAGPVLGTTAFVEFGGGLAATRIAIMIGALAGFAGLALTILMLCNAPTRRSDTERESPGRGLVYSTLRRPGAKASMYVSLVGVGALDLLLVYLPVLGEERDLSPSFVGALLAVRASSSFVARVSLAWLVGRYTRHGILIVTVGLSSLMMLLVPAFTIPPALVAIMATLGLALGVGQPVSLAWSVSVVQPEERSTAIALRLMGNRLGQVVVPGAASLFVVWSGAAAVFLLVGGMLVTSTGAVVLASDRRGNLSGPESPEECWRAREAKQPMPREGEQASEGNRFDNAGTEDQFVSLAGIGFNKVGRNRRLLTPLTSSSLSS